MQANSNVIASMAAQVETEEHNVQMDDGVNLHVRLYRRDDSAPWLVLINSLLSNLSMWDWVVPTLVKTYSLVLYDQRGHGKVKSLTSG